MSKIFVGIDPGKFGAIAFVSSESAEVHAMPLVGGEIDAHAIADLLKERMGKIGCVYIEKVGAMPRNGAVSMFTFGHGFGLLCGITAALNLPMVLVRPQVWQKEMHKNIKGKDTKSKSILAAKRIYPNVELKAENQRVDQDGYADALLIGRYGLKNDLK